MGRDVAEEIYQAFPKKVGKLAALKAIDKALKTHPSEQLLEATKAFAASPAGNAGPYTPHASTFFNQGRFLDDRTTWRRTTSLFEPGIIPQSVINHAEALPSRQEMVAYIQSRKEKRLCDGTNATSVPRMDGSS